MKSIVRGWGPALAVAMAWAAGCGGTASTGTPDGGVDRPPVNDAPAAADADGAAGDAGRDLPPADAGRDAGDAGADAPDGPDGRADAADAAVDAPVETAADAARDAGQPDRAGCVVATGGALDWNVAPVVVTGKLTVAGATSTIGVPGTFWLVEPGTGDEAMLGNTSQASYTVGVFPKTYDVVYRYLSTSLPVSNSFLYARHTNRVVRTGVAISGPTTLDLDFQGATVTGRVTVNGQPNTGQVSTGMQGATLWLKSTTSDDQVLLYSFSGFTTYSALVAPGTYDIYYRAQLFQPFEPGPLHNTNARIASGVVIAGDRTLDIDVPAITVGGSITVGGQTVSTPGGSIILRRADGDPADEAMIGSAPASIYAASIVPGTYDVYFANGGPGAAFGLANQNTRLGGPVTLSASRSNFNVDVPLLTSGGTVRVNGQLVTTEPGARVVLRQPPGGSTLGPLDQGYIASLTYVQFPASVYVIPGIYDVHLVIIEDGLPAAAYVRNQNARVAAGLDLTAAGVVNLDVPAVSLSGQFSAGSAPVATTIELESRTQPGDKALIALTGVSSTYQARVIPAVYDVILRNRTELSTGNIIRNQHAVLQRGVDLSLAQVPSLAATLNVNVTATHLVGTLTQARAGSVGPSHGHLVLRSADKRDTAHLGSFDSFNYDGWVVSGTYDAYYVNDFPTSPDYINIRNANALVGCVVVP